VIYRPPGAYSVFLNEWVTLLTNLNHLKNVLLLGDFNIHVDDVHEHPFLKTLGEFGWKQHVSTATHENGHILDLVLTRNGSFSPIGPVSVHPSVSDHSLVCFEISIPRPLKEKKFRLVRNLKKVDVSLFWSDFWNALLHTSTINNECDDVNINNNIFESYHQVWFHVRFQHMSSANSINCEFSLRSTSLTALM
jgi:hypothetical protein